VIQLEPFAITLEITTRPPQNFLRHLCLTDFSPGQACLHTFLPRLVNIFQFCKMSLSAIVHDDHVDVVCSALAVNCCQFGCFIQNTPRIPCASENHDWMTKLREIAPSKKLRNLVIPGTHDSASVTISKWSLFAAVGLCQNLSVVEQLQRGARYLDTRIGSGVKDSILVDDVNVVHGILTGGKFVKVLEDVDQFLCDNPGEFVVMEVVLENKRQLTAEQRIKVFKLISSTFGDRMITKDDYDSWFNLKYVTLGELAEKNKNVLVLLHERICGFCYEDKTFDMDTVTREFNCHKNENCMRNKWHNTMDSQRILSSNEEFLETYCKHLGKLLNSQFVMTPAFGGVENVPGLLFGMKSLRPVSLARKLYRKEVLETFLRDRADCKWNIVLLDFVDLCPLLVR